MGCGGVGKRVVGQAVENGDAAFDQFEVQGGEEAIEAAVLVFEESVSELDFGGGPFLQGFDGDFEAGIDALEVAVELVEEVESGDFVVELVAFGHGGLSLGLLDCREMVARMCWGGMNILPRGRRRALTPWRVAPLTPRPPLPQGERGSKGSPPVRGLPQGERGEQRLAAGPWSPTRGEGEQRLAAGPWSPTRGEGELTALEDTS